MDRESRRTQRPGANVVGIGAKPICTDAASVRYPPEWKACCREIYEAFRPHMQAKYGGNFAWSRIRNLVMRDFDEYRDGTLVEDSRALTRQDLEHWINSPDAHIGDAKFRYLDRYLHKELLDPESDFQEAVTKVIAFREAEQLQSVHTLHVGPRHKVRDEIHALTDAFAGRLFAVESDDEAQENFQTALYIRPSSNARYLVVAFYYKFTPDSAADIIEFGYRYYGILMPLSLAGQIKQGEAAYGILKLFDRSLLSTKEAIFHNCAHCYFVASDRSLRIAPIEASTNPFRAGAMPDPNKKVIRSTMAETLPGILPSYVFTETDLIEVPVSDEQRKLLNSLQDKYLLW